MTKSNQTIWKNLRDKPWTKGQPIRLIGWIFLAFGILVLASSVLFSSTILAFIGLGFAFWGPLLLYVSPEKYIRKTLFESSLIPYLECLNQIITEMKYLGNGVYLPPKYLKDFDKCKILISKSKDFTLPSPEIIQKKSNNIFLRNPKALLLYPHGLSLTELFEKKLGTSFTRVNFEYLQQNLPKLLVQDLEIAEDLQIEKENSLLPTSKSHLNHTGNKEYETFNVRITNSIYEEASRRLDFSDIYGKFGSPLCSAIACSFAKAVGKAIIIKEVNFSSNGKIVDACFQSLELLELKEPTTIFTGNAVLPVELHSIPLSARFRITHWFTNIGALLMIVGTLLMIWIGLLTLNDIFRWGKDITTIFFASRAWEAISLGIDMRVIHYFLISLGFLGSGLLFRFQKKSKKG